MKFMPTVAIQFKYTQFNLSNVMTYKKIVTYRILRNLIKL